MPPWQVPGRAPKLGGVHEAGSRHAVDRDVGCGGDSTAVLQSRDAGVDVADRGAQAVEICDEGVPRVRLAFGPAVAGDATSTRCPGWLGREGRFGRASPDDPGRELGLDQIEDPAALCTGAVDKVARIQRPEIVGPQEAAVRFGLGPGVAAEPQAAPRGAGSLRRGA